MNPCKWTGRNANLSIFRPSIVCTFGWNGGSTNLFKRCDALRHCPCPFPLDSFLHFLSFFPSFFLWFPAKYLEIPHFQEIPSPIPSFQLLWSRICPTKLEGLTWSLMVDLHIAQLCKWFCKWLQLRLVRLVRLASCQQVANKLPTFANFYSLPTANLQVAVAAHDVSLHCFPLV